MFKASKTIGEKVRIQPVQSDYSIEMLIELIQAACRGLVILLNGVKIQLDIANREVNTSLTGRALLCKAFTISTKNVRWTSQMNYIHVTDLQSGKQVYFNIGLDDMITGVTIPAYMETPSKLDPEIDLPGGTCEDYETSPAE